MSNSDILQQALENSGLPSGDAATGVVVSASSTTELISVAPLPLTSLQCAPITQTVTTMTLQDAATGSVKKHIIRKVESKLSLTMFKLFFLLQYFLQVGNSFNSRRI